MSMTIKEVADAIGVSKTYVRRFMDTDFREKYVETTAENHILVSAEGYEKLLEIIGKREKQPETISENPEKTGFDDVITIMQQTIDLLQQQLQVKDQQISDLTAALKAAQALNAGTLKQLSAGEPATQPSETQHRHWWQRWRV